MTTLRGYLCAFLSILEELIVDGEKHFQQNLQRTHTHTVFETKKTKVTQCPYFRSCTPKFVDNCLTDIKVDISF